MKHRIRMVGFDLDGTLLTEADRIYKGDTEKGDKGRRYAASGHRAASQRSAGGDLWL